MNRSDRQVKLVRQHPVEMAITGLDIFVVSLAFFVTLTGAAPANGARVTLYDFHSTVRCETCVMIETLADATLRAKFPDELSKGALVWRPLDVQRPAKRV